MKYLALELPGGQVIAPPPGFENSGITNLGSFIYAVLNLAIAISAVLLFFWLIWGIFQYIYAGGDKESLGKARSRITLALVGFFIVVIAFAISQFAREIIPFRSQSVINVTTPP